MQRLMRTFHDGSGLLTQEEKKRQQQGCKVSACTLKCHGMSDGCLSFNNSRSILFAVNLHPATDTTEIGAE